MNVRDRIRELRRVRAGDLRPHPRNWRTHPQRQRDALRGVLAEIGYADALLVRELDDGGLQLIDGHLRAETTPEAEVPVLVLDLDEQEADKLLALHDPLAALAGRDEAALSELLQDMETENQAVQELLEELAAPAVLPLSTDEHPQQPREVDVPETWQLLVDCRDEEDQRQLYEQLKRQGYHCRVLTL